MRWALHLIVACLLVGVRCISLEGEGTVRVERVALSHERGRVTELRVYNVAIFEVPLPAAVHIERDDSASAAATAPNGTAFRDDSPHGLSRLLCESQLFESFAPPNSAQHEHTRIGTDEQRAAREQLNSDTHTQSAKHKSQALPQWLSPPAPPAYLVPLNFYNEMSVHPLYHLVSSLFVSGNGGASSGATLSFGVLLSYSEPARLGSGSASAAIGSTHTVNVLDRRKLRKCRLSFLDARHQAITPPGAYVTDSDRNSLSGSTFTFNHINELSTAAAAPTPATTAASSTTASANTNTAAAATTPVSGRYFPDRMAARSMFFASQSVYGSAGFAGWKQIKLPCTYSPSTHGIFLQTHMSARGQTELLTRANTGTGAASKTGGKLKAGAGVVPIIAGLWKGLVTPLLDTLCDGVADPIGALLYWGVGDVMLPGLRDALHLQLTHAVPPAITEGLVPCLIETIPDTVTHHALRYIEQYTTETLPKRLQAEITHLVVPIAIEDISRLSKANIPRLTTVLASRVMSHMLTRALTLTVVPALSHTLSHAPYQEFYCRRCIEEQLMCPRCYYTIDKIYYAMFYASYYSTYYSDYYTRYYSNILEDQIAVQARKQIEIRKFAERFETVYDDTAENGGAIYGHGTWPGLIKIT